MTLPQVISRNQTQKISAVPLTGRVVLQPNTWYTCPTGKKAIVKGKVQCTGLGAAATATFTIAGVIMYEWIVNATPPDPIIEPRQLDVGAQTFGTFEVELAAGETVVTSQNTGTNAEFNLFADVIESSV